MSAPHICGVLAEFASAEELLAAVRRVRSEARSPSLEAYAPYPVEGLAEALGYSSNAIPRATLLGGVLGGIGTFALEWYAAVIDYPINVGGRPQNSWPAFLPPAIEMALLFAAVFGVIAMLVGNRLPQLHHPLFGLDVFERASADRFFLLLRIKSSASELNTAAALLNSLHPLVVTEVSA